MWHLKSKPDTVVSVLAEVMTHEHLQSASGVTGQVAMQFIATALINPRLASTFLHLPLPALATIPFHSQLCGLINS